MVRVIPLSLLLVVAAAFAADEPRPSPLTKQQAADGWLSLFDGETLYGWEALGGSKWTVFKGMLAPQGDTPATLVTNTAFRSYEAVIVYQTRAEKVQAQFGVEVTDGKLGGAASGVNLEPTGLGTGTLKAKVLDNRVVETYLEIAHPGGVSGSATGSKLGGPVAPKDVPARPLALTGSNFVIKSLRIKPLDTKPLFNGKDLTGWNTVATRKGKFTVTEQGYLAVKDGAGDLSTEGQYADFVLQLECKTNGKHLNSGIFFRAIPGQYQNGYEAQIHNGWQEKAKQFDLDVYDPATNKLKEKVKLDTLAMDGGTGAIYRRIPARKQLAQDDEWFTLTVVANGRHIATWVNGVQAVDWTDNRPLGENPRQACRLEKGTISIQAHDPTTDLLFRNLRIAEMGKK